MKRKYSKQVLGFEVASVEINVSTVAQVATLGAAGRRADREMKQQGFKRVGGQDR